MSTPSRGAPPKPTFDVPDLDLEPAAPPPTARQAATRPASGAHQIRTQAQPAPSATDDLEFDLDPVTSLELDGEVSPRTRQPERSRQAAPGYGTLASLDDDFSLDEAVALEAIGAPVDTKPWPRGRTNDAKQSLLTPEDIAECAAYGSKPPFYLAPAYTWRVWNRRQDLARLLNFQQSELANRESERDRLLVELALSLTPDLEKQERFRGMLSELSATKRTLEGHEQTLAASTAAVSKAVGVHDAELTRVGAELRERAKVVDTRRAARDAKAAEHQRACAKLKRVQIEIRNATDKGRAIVGPQGGALPANLARQLSELDGLQASLMREVEQRQGELDVANRDLDEAEQPVAETERHIASLRTQKALTLEGSRQKVESETTHTLSAKATHTEVAKRIAAAVLDLKGAIPVDRITLDRIQGADDRVEANLTEIEKLTLALDAYDRDAYGLGIKLALAPFVFALVFLLLRAFL